MSGPFKLKSGNTTPFKQMGSSPVKQDYDKEGNWIGAGPHPESLYAKMSDAEKNKYMKSKESEVAEELPTDSDYGASEEFPGATQTDSDVLAAQEVSDVTPKFKKEGKKKVTAKKEEVKEKVTPEIGHTVVSRTGRSPGPGYEKIKGTNQWEYTGYGV